MSFEGGGETTRALSQILDTAYNLEFNERTSTSAVRLLVERLRQAFQVCMTVLCYWTSYYTISSNDYTFSFVGQISIIL